jgi:hypothetical protein
MRKKRLTKCAFNAHADRMTLDEWMNQNRITNSELARRLKLTHEASIRRWRAREVFPHKPHRDRIKKITSQQVTDADMVPVSA